MRSIAKMFGRSPFIPLQSHMEMVATCVESLPKVMAAWEARDEAQIAELCTFISNTEYQADQLKRDIRNSLPRGLFLPVDRVNLLRILNTQDGIADRAENIAVLTTFKFAVHLEGFKALFENFMAKNLAAFTKVKAIIGELDELLESGFGGAEARRVGEMADEVARSEYESDVAQRGLLKELLSHEDTLSYGDFFLWTRIIKQWSEISDRSEQLANAVRLTLEAK